MKHGGLGTNRTPLARRRLPAMLVTHDVPKRAPNATPDDITFVDVGMGRGGLGSR